jgi:hypothetical protein
LAIKHFLAVHVGGKIFKGKYGHFDIAAKKHGKDTTSDLDGDVAIISHLVHLSILRVYGFCESPTGHLYTVRKLTRLF